MAAKKDKGKDVEKAPVPSKEKTGTPVDPEVVLEQLNSLPPNIRQVVTARFSGPLPPPDVFGGYDKVLPGAAERILKMAEDEAQHRRSQEAKMVDSECRDASLGLNHGRTIALVALLVSGAVAIWGNAWVGGALGVSSIASLVGVFVYGSRQKSFPPSPSSSPDEQSQN